MEKVFVGKIVNTHGIKGELRIKSDFEKKELVFVVGKSLIIRNQVFEIKTYRVHKDYDMVTFVGFDNINQVLIFKGEKVYVDRSQLALQNEDYLLADLISMQVFLEKESLGVVKDYTNGLNPLLVVEKENKTYYIPLKGNFIKKVNVKENTIEAYPTIKELFL